MSLVVEATVESVQAPGATVLAEITSSVRRRFFVEVPAPVGVGQRVRVELQPDDATARYMGPAEDAAAGQP